MESPRARLVAGALTVTVALAVVACDGPPRPIDVVEATIAQIQDQIRSGRTTCRLVVQAYLDRIETYDEATVNAITVVNPNALARADEIDDAISIAILQQRPLGKERLQTGLDALLRRLAPTKAPGEQGGNEHAENGLWRIR